MSSAVAPRPFRMMTLGLLAVSIILVEATLPGPRAHSLGLLMLVSVVWVSENYASSFGGYSASMAFPLTMTALLLYGPVSAQIVAGASALRIEALRGGRALWTSCFNVGQLVISASIAAWVFSALGGRFLIDGTGAAIPLSGTDFPQVLIPTTAAALVCAAANIAFAAGGASALSGDPLVGALTRASRYLPSFLALAVIGYMVAQVMAISEFALALFVLPLFISGQLYRRALSLHRARTDTIRSLIRALEAKDEYTRGHSERVSSYAVALAQEMGLSQSDTDVLEIGALLHDIGKLSIPSAVLRKRTPLSQTEWQTIRAHAARGADLLRRIPVLVELCDCVAQHHERLDGSGYPEGLGADQITLAARVLAVADAFDAMTSSRPYREKMSREDALSEIVSCAGSQFDSTVVQALLRLEGSRITPSPSSLPVAPCVPATSQEVGQWA